jgi:hypothetical protein
MQYWKRIKIKNFELIQKKTLEFIQRQADILDKDKYRGPFINLQHLGYFNTEAEAHEAYLHAKSLI